MNQQINSDRQRGLYRSEFEHDNCGVGMVANLSGEASHDIVVSGVTILKRLLHRGATGNDPETGDGAGLLLKIPQDFFRKKLKDVFNVEKRSGREAETFGIAMIFGGEGEEKTIEETVKAEGCEVLGWRDVPIDPDAIGRDARAVMPRIRQMFIRTSDFGLQTSEVLSQKSDVLSFERRLYIIRRQIEKATAKTYICSCSSKTIVYKGLLLATQIEKFYLDLSDPDFISPFAIVHQRYSTNTFPSWELAHPFRAIAHNGEINALKGNLNALAAREGSLASPLFGDELKKLLPVVHGGQSDSASLDNVFELLVAAGRDAPHAMMMLIPQAWGAKYHVGHDVRAFYEYHSALMEPWDGPAAVCFTDGTGLGAALDRNGLRPARWTLTKSGLFVLASEAGVLDIAPEEVERHGRLRPGALLWLDLTKHRLMENTELKTYYARRQPYRRWVKENHIPVTGLFTEIVPSAVQNDGTLAADRTRFGWTLEDVELIVRPMAETGHEPVGAMGNDATLACLSRNRRSLFDFFHQLFAQVTNPPIDPIREELVMSIMTYIGNKANILAETSEHAHLVKMTRPVLTDDELNRLKNVATFPAVTLRMGNGEWGTEKGWLKAALDRLAADAVDAAKNGAKIIILSDREFLSMSQSWGVCHGNTDSPSKIEGVAVGRGSMTGDEIIPPRPFGALPLSQGESLMNHSQHCDIAKFLSAKIAKGSSDKNPCDLCGQKRIPSLLAVAAVHKALTEAGLRSETGVVVESGEVLEVHHFAVLLGFGATAINPYLALATVAELAGKNAVEYSSNYVSAVCKGIMKIMSKMGISTLRSYRSAKIFEAVGLGANIMRDYFPGVVSPVGGLELEDIENLIEGVRGNLGSPGCCPPGGQYRFRKEGEEHLWNPLRVIDFREVVRNDDFARFKRYTDDIDQNSHVTLRSQLDFNQGDSVEKDSHSAIDSTRSTRSTRPIPNDSVESIDSIVKHFIGGAMSLGSLSPEAHETIALALNGLGTMSNSGEGGENPERFGTDRNSAIKQVASGRFGVTIEYLSSARDLQIKLAQGAKPGEGGQLPGYKVDAFIGHLRHAKPGTTLISPPPHHDIYSIEDLAELIYDLKCANPGARVSVKLVSEAGVGTIAAGVAKAHADVIVISGFDGGTGAAPLTSVKHAGLPWEMGLAEAHQTLVKNNLRARVKLQVDGQLRTGRDIVIAAMLGADEFAFGTSMLVSLGCVQCRNCNLNCCPVGIATQKPELRAKFAGKPEHLQRYFRFLAEEVREILASLGLASLAEVRGRADLLKAKEGSCFDFGDLLATKDAKDIKGSNDKSLCGLYCEKENYDVRELIPAVERGERVLERKISNRDRAVGAALSGWLVAHRPTTPPPNHSTTKPLNHLTINFTGTAGQSFGAFLHRDVSFTLAGEANDYVGKSLSGGSIAIKGNVGNVIAYGATSGEIFIAGTAGERFAVRNSGATLVVEGVGDHGCEYMTGGMVAVLGPTGVNFGAGMTGGVAYVLDESGDLDLNCNLDSLDLFPVEEGSPEEADLLALLERHKSKTGSAKAADLLADWSQFRPRFTKVQPHGQMP